MTSSIVDNLKNYGFSDAIAEQLNENELPARVVRVDRLFLQLVNENGITMVPYPHDGGPVATGDWLALTSDGPGELAVARILPRISQLVRKAAFDNSSDSQLLAANIDLIGIVVPID
ncbi:GTPase [Renibacterium salmoninarum ATCC 33209]|uniref:GTPase n=1 Tax=Renibacterium salmoninarum (strain ATCC 33209 / DSM 20767 / JCM 11484 / NBRC 15589 / NCIMB 2235) TaxID=288705 RepID=A9WPC3_RENSM|nr:GTPase [Renibacterium salmoninarum]ABY22880.1 GTPase [Renibacterium salmoninarum ATCC 33209]